MKWYERTRGGAVGSGLSLNVREAKVQDAFREDGSPIDEGYERRIVTFLDEHEWYARALKADRERDQDRERSNCSAQHLIASQP